MNRNIHCRVCGHVTELTKFRRAQMLGLCPGGYFVTFRKNVSPAFCTFRKDVAGSQVMEHTGGEDSHLSLVCGLAQSTDCRRRGRAAASAPSSTSCKWALCLTPSTAQFQSSPYFQCFVKPSNTHAAHALLQYVEVQMTPRSLRIGALAHASRHFPASPPLQLTPHTHTPTHTRH